MNIGEMDKYKKTGKLPSGKDFKPPKGFSMDPSSGSAGPSKEVPPKKGAEKSKDNKGGEGDPPKPPDPPKPKPEPTNSPKGPSAKERLLQLGESAFEVGEGISKTAAFGFAGILYFFGTVFFAIGVVSIAVNVLVTGVTGHSIGTFWIGVGLTILGFLLQRPMYQIDAVGRARLAEEEQKLEEKAKAMNKENELLKGENKRLKGGK